MRERLAVSSGDRVGAAVSPARALRYRALLQEVLARADIRLDGARRFDIEVSDARLYERVVRGGALALREAYVDGWRECDALDELTSRFLGANLHKWGFYTPRLLLTALALKARGAGDKSQAFEVGERHYDLGNRLFTLMLDNRASQSSRIVRSARSLSHGWRRLVKFGRRVSPERSIETFGAMFAAKCSPCIRRAAGSTKSRWTALIRNLRLAIARKAIAEKVGFGAVVPSNGADITNVSWAFDPSLPSTP